MSHPDWAIRTKAALTTCGLIFFGCGGVAVDDSLGSDDASDEYQRDVVKGADLAQPDAEPDLDVWLSDDQVENDQPGSPGAEGSPCDCPQAEYGIALLGPDEMLVFNRPLDEPWLVPACGLPSAIFDPCGKPVVLGACHETEGCILFSHNASGLPTLYRYDQEDGGITEVQGDSIDLSVSESGDAVSGVLEFRSGAALYQGSYRLCAPNRPICDAP